MRPGARNPPLDAVLSSLCLVALLHCVQAAAVSEGGVYSGESGSSSERWLNIEMHLGTDRCCIAFGCVLCPKRMCFPGACTMSTAFLFLK